MMKKIFIIKIIITLYIFYSFKIFAQQISPIPPISFNGKVNICDSSSFKLVFFDDFNGSTLDKSKWNDYVSWNGMTDKGDTENWGGARKADGDALYLSENVEVSNGTCKLILKHGDCKWSFDANPHPDTTTIETLYGKKSGGYIATPYHLSPSNKPNYYNSGMFEARIKFPRISGAWSAFWTWAGSEVNEIDIAESYGGKINRAWLRIQSNSKLETRPNTINVLHAWAPSDNPYNLPENVGISRYFPNQGWQDWYKGTQFKQEEWHVYNCIWDTTSISIFLDNELVSKFYKYVRPKQVSFKHPNGSLEFYDVIEPTYCIPDSGKWFIAKGYPWNNYSNSQIRLNTRFCNENAPNPNHLPQEERQMEIDYVKAWQRHPELDNHTVIKDLGNQTKIIGPQIINSVSRLFINSNSIKGVWTANNDGVILKPSTKNNEILIHPNPNSKYNKTVIFFSSESVSNEPSTSICKTIYINNKNTTTTIVHNRFPNTENFCLNVDNPIPESTYDWKVWVGKSRNSDSLQYLNYKGTHINTPILLNLNETDVNLKWELTVSNDFGSYIINGNNNNSLIHTSPLQSYVTKNFPSTYFEASFNKADSLQYELTIREVLSNKIIENTNDSNYINTTINRIRFELLEPYLIFNNEDFFTFDKKLN